MSRAGEADAARQRFFDELRGMPGEDLLRCTIFLFGYSCGAAEDVMLAGSCRRGRAEVEAVEFVARAVLANLAESRRRSAAEGPPFEPGRFRGGRRIG